MELLPSLRMTANLNALIIAATDVRLASEAIIDSDVAHHVIDANDLLGLNPLRANDLLDALVPLLGAERDMWVLTLPIPGDLGSLRGPRELNQAALEVGQAVVASSAGLALVPYRVGSAVQWRVFAAERPFAPPTPYDAERALSEAVVRAAAMLTQLDVAAGVRPRDPQIRLAAGYDSRQHASATRSARLLVACNAALSHDGASISSFEAEQRSRELRTVRDAASQALCATATWLRPL